MLCKSEAIVIRSLDYGEGHKILLLLTAESGKVSVMARGAKKPRSRLAAAAQMFTHGEYTYYQQHAGKMGTLNHGEIIDAHQPLREHLLLGAYAAYLAELVDRLVADQEGRALFPQLAAALEALERGKDAAIVAHLFELRVLEETGYAPMLDACVQCRRDIDAERAAISAGAGGVVCADCRKSVQDAIAVGAKPFTLLRLFQRTDLRRLGNVSVSEETKRELARILDLWIRHHIGIPFKSRHFIEQMEKHGL